MKARPVALPLRNRFLLLLLALSLSLALNLHAQAPVLHFEHVFEVNPFVFDLHQDREGFLWIGGEGLYRYDGHNFKRYASIPEDTTSLSGWNIKIIYEDRAGTLWIGTDMSSGGAGLNRYNRETDTFTRFVNDPNDPASLSASAVRAIHEDRAGVLWVGTGVGLHRFDRETETFTRPNFNPSNTGSPNGDSNGLMFPTDAEAAIYEDGAGTLWMGTRGLTATIRQPTPSLSFGMIRMTRPAWPWVGDYDARRQQGSLSGLGRREASAECMGRRVRFPATDRNPAIRRA